MDNNTIIDVDKEDFELSKIEVRKKYGHDIDIEIIITRAENFEKSNEIYVHQLHMLEMDYYKLETKYNKLLKEINNISEKREIED